MESEVSSCLIPSVLNSIPTEGFEETGVFQSVIWFPWVSAAAYWLVLKGGQEGT